MINQINTNLETINNKVYATSRDIANKLGKEHKDVVKKINEVLTVGEFSEREFKTNQGNKYKEYLLDKDAFVLLLMNYTGFNDFKRAYIKRFNEMEQALKSNSQNIRIEANEILRYEIPLKYNLILRKDYFHYKLNGKQLLFDVLDFLDLVDFEVTKDKLIRIADYQKLVRQDGCLYITSFNNNGIQSWTDLSYIRQYIELHEKESKFNKSTIVYLLISNFIKNFQTNE